MEGIPFEGTQTGRVSSIVPNMMEIDRSVKWIHESHSWKEGPFARVCKRCFTSDSGKVDVCPEHPVIKSLLNK